MVLALGRDVDLQAAVLQFQVALAAIQAVGELAVGKGHVLALDRDLRLPGEAVEAELDDGVNQAFRLDLLPFLLERVRQDRPELIVQRQLADDGLDSHRAGRLQAAAAGQDQRGLVAAGLELLDGKALVVNVDNGVDLGQRARQPRVVDPPAANWPVTLNCHGCGAAGS